jgi:YidC/Oxa1 family membrane protein insertase
MKKNDFIIVGVLIAMMFAWMRYYPAIEQKYFPRPEQPVAEETAVAEPVSDLPVASMTEPVEEALQVVESVAAEVEDALPAEETKLLSNDRIELEISSYGGVICSAVLLDYPARNEEDGEPLMLDFTSAPALRYDGLSVRAGQLTLIEGGLVYTAALEDGNVFKRTFRLEEDYLLTVEDSFVNSSSGAWVLPDLRLSTGSMSNPEGTSAMKGVSTLGIDTFSPVEGVQHWGKKLNKLFSKGLKDAKELTTTPALIEVTPVDWIAAKNKFFVQILTPEEGADGFDFTVRREGEGKKAVPADVEAALQFDSELLASGETFSRSVRVYTGPKDFSFLKTQGMEQTEVMEFKSTGFWKFMNPIMYPLKRALLWGLIHFAPFGSYGIAILLLTVIIRVLFWPLTHKSTDSMKRMQELQPQMQALKEKYKDNPQRLQQETMLLYKENKVNPMGGCLPMFIQIPVFIALFGVLRSAIELRFSRFLWISDLSEPENLFAGMVPVVGSLNILPILMAATMMWQQKLTTGGNTAATPEQAQQQKMMMVMMPVMMLFFFYSMPSGLVLYWTTSQVLMIAQLLIRKKRSA